MTLTGGGAGEAARDTERLFPGGLPSAEQLVFVIEADGAEAGRRGLTHIGLGVMGGNETARRLYRSLAYTETFVSIEKPVTRKPE